MVAKALSFTEVVEQVADNAEDVYQNDADEYLSGPEEESIESETENTQSAAYDLMRRALETRMLSCASVLFGESRLWLDMINRRLGGRWKIRNPFNGECCRDIPYAVFGALQAALKSSTEFIEPNCYISSNRKAAMISFTSLKSVINLFTIICGYTEMEVRKYCSRSLKSKGKAEPIVNEVKDFAFIYKYEKGQFIISFNFGIWNLMDFLSILDVW
jgi:hypothetical protein